MDLRTFILCVASSALALGGIVYGVKFNKKGNYLVGYEWLILALSSSNALIYFATGLPISLHVAHFFDAFSRAFGVPIVTTLGLMTLTHGYKPSIRTDIVLFAGSFAGTAVLVTVGSIAPLLPYLYLVMWVLFSIYLAYFARQLLNVGEARQASALLFAMVLNLVIASIYDFYKIPGEETNIVFNFFTLALFTWAYLTVQVYYAYCALERARGLSTRASLISKSAVSSSR